MGGVLFSAKAEAAKSKADAAKSKPATNRSEIESRLQEISAPARPSELLAEASLPLAPLAHDPAPANDPPVANDRPVTNTSDRLDILSSLSEAGISLSPHQDILTEFQAAIAVSTSSNRQAR